MFAELAAPIVTLLNQLMGPLLLVVGALGSLYCVVLGVKYAKAEEPQEREKAKGALKGAVVGFVLIFVLILALNILMPNMIEWVNDSIKQYNPQSGDILDAMQNTAPATAPATAPTTTTP